MATYTTRIGLEKQADGENPNSWGDILNQNVIDLIDTAVAGYEIVSVSSVPVSLTSNNGAADTARSFGLRFEGTLTADVTVTIPQKEKIYFVYNQTSGSFKVFMKTAGGTAVTVSDQNSGIMVACDSVGINKVGEFSTSVSAFTANTINVITKVSGKDAHFDGIVSVSSFSAVDINATAISLVSATTSVLAATSVSVSALYAQKIDAVSVSASSVKVTTLVATSASITTLAGLLVAGTPLVMNPITVSASIAQAHGLGAAPSFCAIVYECLSTDAGYSAGDKLFGNSQVNTFQDYFNVQFDNTNLYARTNQSATGAIINKTTKVNTTMNYANWKATVTPYKVS